MNKPSLALMGAGGLVVLVALSSLAAAAPAAKNTPVPHAALTPTPLPSNPDEDEAGAADQAPELEVGAAALAPIAPGPMTSRLFVFNLDTSLATVAINFLDASGHSVATLAPFPLAPNGAVAKSLPANLPSPFRGSAVVSSDKKVQAFVTDRNSRNTARDEYEGTVAPSAKLVFPFVRHLAPTTQNSLIAVQNTSSGPATITLQLYDPSGKLVAAPTANGVAALASTSFDTSTLFPAGTFIGSAEISAGGTMALAGSEQTRYLKDTASFPALTAAESGTTLYAGFVERQRNTAGVPIRWSELYVRNEGSSPTDISVQVYSAAGVLKSAASKTRAGVPPKGLAQFRTNAAEFASLTQATTYFKGWAVLSSSNSPQPLAMYALDARSSGTLLFGTSGLASSGTRFGCGDTLRYSTPSQHSTINLVNPGGTAATVTVRLYKPSTGALGGTKTVLVGAHKLVSVLLTASAFAGAGTAYEGLAVVSSAGAPILASVYTPYAGGGMTSYACTRLP